MATQMSLKKYLLGVDVGSTKTHAMLADTNGKALGFSQGGGGNYEVVGVEGMTNTINSVISDCLHKVKVSQEEILAMGFGISGYDWPSEKPMMIDAIDSLSIPAKYKIANDAEIGLIAGAPDGWGIAVDAGTGNNIRGRGKAGESGRITGNSISFGEFGGASELVWLAITAATYAWSLRGPKTKLTSIFMEHTGVESEDTLIEGLATHQINLSPTLAKDIIQAAIDGDKVAQDIVDFSAHDLAKNVISVIKQLDIKDENFDIVLIGSMFKSGDIYISPFSQTILAFAPNARFISLEVPPVLGAVLLAAEKVDLLSQDFRKTLNQSTRALLDRVNLIS